jgi:hypothetical protein
MSTQRGFHTRTDGFYHRLHGCVTIKNYSGYNLVLRIYYSVYNLFVSHRNPAVISLSQSEALALCSVWRCCSQPLAATFLRAWQSSQTSSGVQSAFRLYEDQNPRFFITEAGSLYKCETIQGATKAGLLYHCLAYILHRLCVHSRSCRLAAVIPIPPRSCRQTTS